MGDSKGKGPELGRSPCVLEQLGWILAIEVAGPARLHLEPLEPSAGWQVSCFLLRASPGSCVQVAEAGRVAVQPPASPGVPKGCCCLD